MIVESYAKINWSLRITGRRADGFHDLETVFQTISLHDTITLSEAEGLALTCGDPSIPTGETNLALRAARAAGAKHLAIHIEKRIPAGGGLGGGSSNAAATLIALNKPDPQIALSLGSDVPFFLVGGTAYATGRGEILTPMPPMSGIPLLLVLPEERVMTKDAFARITRYSPPLGIEAYREWMADGGLRMADALSAIRHPRSAIPFTNDFEEPVFALLPRLRAFKQRLLDAGAVWAGMSGSGSTIVGAFKNPAERDRAAGSFEDVRVERCESL